MDKPFVTVGLKTVAQKSYSRTRLELKFLIDPAIMGCESTSIKLSFSHATLETNYY